MPPLGGSALTNRYAGEGSYGARPARRLIAVRAVILSLALVCLVPALVAGGSEAAFSAKSASCRISSLTTSDHCAASHEGSAVLSCVDEISCEIGLHGQAAISTRLPIPSRWEVRFHEPYGTEPWRVLCGGYASGDVMIDARSCDLERTLSADFQTRACERTVLQTVIWQAEGHMGTFAETVFTGCRDEAGAITSFTASSSSAGQAALDLP